MDPPRLLAIQILLRNALAPRDFASFTSSDLEGLVRARLDSAPSLSQASDALLLQALPNRGFLIAPLREAFSPSAVLIEMFKEFHLSTLHAPGGSIVDAKVAVPLAGCLLKLEMPSGYYPNDVPENGRLYVRKDCEELFGVLLNKLDQKPAVSTLPDLFPDKQKKPGTRSKRFWMLFLGNPGTGKSLTGLVLLFLFVVRSFTVVYHMRKLGEEVYFVFSEGKLLSVVDPTQAIRYLVDPRTIYIHDGSAIARSGIIKAATLLITGPERKVYKDFSKVSGGYGTFYGRLWSMEELQACWRTVHWCVVSWETVLENVYFVGRIPRLVFVPPEEFESVRSLITTTTNLEDVFSLIGPHNINSTFSHMLVHLDRGRHSSVGYTTIASDFVKEQLLLRLEVKHWRTAVLKYRSLQGVTALADFRGSLMELLMHLTFPRFIKGCKRICDGMHVGQHSDMVLLDVDETEDLHVFFYSSFDDLQHKIEKCLSLGYSSAYFWPRMKTEAAIDSLYVNFKTGYAYLLQLTLAKRHPVVWHPVKKLTDYLQQKLVTIAGLYFITSATNYPSFGYQTWKKTRPVPGQHGELQTMPRLCQYKVKLEMLEGDMENIEALNKFASQISDNLKGCEDVPEEHVRPGKSRLSASDRSGKPRPEGKALRPRTLAGGSAK